MSPPPEEPTDERLAKATLSGDDEAFAELVRRHKRKVFRTVSRFVGNDELDDICQEIFIKVYHNLKDYRGEAPFGHWLTRIAVNACYDSLRKRRREGNSVSLDTVDFSMSGPASEEVRNSGAWEILRQALGKLSPEDRIVITLLHLEEKTVREISAQTGWSESKVKVRAFRARKELKKILEDEDGNRTG